MTNERGTLREGEPHPAVEIAKEFLRGTSFDDLLSLQGAFSSCAIEGNRLAEVCGGTFGRIINKDPVSDRYLLGLTVVLMDLKLKEKK